MKTDNLIQLKHKNLKRVINYIRGKENNTKKEIADSLNLSFATVSNMCNALENRSLIKYINIDDTKIVGRSPKYIHFRKNRLFSICVNIHTSGRVDFILTNLVNEVIAIKNYYYEDITDYDVFLTELEKYYSDFIQSKNIMVDDIIGIGVIMSAIFDEISQKVVASEMKLFENQPMKDDFTKIFGKEVLIDNDANLCAFGAKMAFGGHNLVYIYIGEGLGIGIVHGGKVLRGERGYGPEICHMPIGELDIECPLCGNKHCLETDLSFSGFLTKYRNGEAKDRDISWTEFIDKVNDGDLKALEVVGNNARILSIAMTAVVSLFQPEKIVIGGDIDECLFNLMKNPILEVINSRKIVNSMSDYIIDYDCDYRTNVIKGMSEEIYSQWYLEI